MMESKGDRILPLKLNPKMASTTMSQLVVVRAVVTGIPIAWH